MDDYTTPETTERGEPQAPPEKHDTLWRLAVGPLIWALHFILSYVTVAVWCAKVAGRDGSLAGARLAVIVYSLLAVAGIGRATWRSWRRARFGNATVPHDFDTAADRHRFIGFAAVLLCGLSLVATLYVALGAVFLGSCH